MRGTVQERSRPGRNTLLEIYRLTSNWFKKIITGGNVVRFAADGFMQIRARLAHMQFALSVSTERFATVPIQSGYGFY